MARNYSTDAIVLGSHKLGEADRVVTVFTAQRGKVPTVVKGVRKIKSRFGGRLEPFSYLQVQLYEGRNLHTLTGADTIRTHAAIRDNLDSLRCGLAFIDMLSRAVPEMEQRPRTFNLSLNFLDELDQLSSQGSEAGAKLALTLGAQLKLLLLAGYLPHLSHCASCGGGGLTRFSAAVGGALCGSCSGESFSVAGDTLDTMRYLLETPLAGAGEAATGKPTAHEVWLCIREVCRYHLGVDLKVKPF